MSYKEEEGAKEELCTPQMPAHKDCLCVGVLEKIEKEKVSLWAHGVSEEPKQKHCPSEQTCSGRVLGKFTATKQEEGKPITEATASTVRTFITTTLHKEALKRLWTLPGGSKMRSHLSKVFFNYSDC